MTAIPLFTAPLLFTNKIKNKPTKKQIVSDFIKDLKSDEIMNVTIRPRKHIVYYETQSGYNTTNYPESNEFWRIVLNTETDVKIDEPVFGFTDAFSIVFTAALFVSLFRSLAARNVVDKKVENNITTRFSDVQGIDQAKTELEEIVDFLRNPTKYTESGARVPKGALLVGAPGTGKTLLARAIAGESSVPFIQISASSLVEMFVGVGAKRVRDIFNNARSVQPCIIFIDEIDAIGKKRSTNGFPSNDEREQTINQLLTEMDGFDNKSQIVVIAATNRADVLDDALLRPGRFDRKIQVRLPSALGRENILAVHSQNKKIDETVSLTEIANQTVNFTGAALENLLNECAIRAVKDTDDGVITNDIVENVYQRIVIGAKNDMHVPFETRERIARHEAGHAIVGALIPNFDKVRKVSVVPRGDSGGITFFQPRTDGTRVYTKEYMLSQVKVALGGHAAEELAYGKNNVSSGASGDFAQVYSIAREMILTYGFGNIGKINVTQEQVSQATMQRIDSEIQDVVDVCYAQTLELLTLYDKPLDKLTDTLVNDDIVDGDVVYALVNTFGR